MQNKLNIVKGCILIAFSFLLFACAQKTQPLTGGPKDTIPPKIVYSIPPLNDTSVNTNKIVIKFNEFITLNNIDAQFFSSPPIYPKPDFSLKKKKLIITFKSNLEDSATYCFDFGEAIKDYHEGNILNNFEYKFSTYNQFDSLKISGKIIDAFTQNPVKNTIVMLYNINVDSLPLKQLPLYACKTDSLGNFTFTNLRQQNYKIFALEDLNGNFIFDPDENNIAYLNQLLKPYVEDKIFIDTLDSGYVYFKNTADTIPDTLRQDSIVVRKESFFYPDNITLNVFSQPSPTQKVKNIIRDFRGRIKIFFVKPLIDNYCQFEINGKNLNLNQYTVENFPSKDSLYLWIKDSSIFDKDTIIVNLSYYIDDTKEIGFDTIISTQYLYSSDTSELQIKAIEKNINLFGDFLFSSETPDLKIDTNKIKLYKIIDTLVTDKKEQNIKYIRPEKDSLIFIFKRPISRFNIKFRETENNTVQFLWKKNNYGDSVFVKLLNEKQIHKDTIFCKVFFDNEYFYGQKQDLSEDLKIVLTNQNINSVKRELQDSITLNFAKNLTESFQIKVLNLNKNSYKIKKQNNNLIIKLLDSTAINTDTIKLAYKYRNFEEDPNSIKEDTIAAIYIFDRQKIVFSRRYSRGNIIIAFHKPLLENPDLKLLSIKTLGRWETSTLNKTRDSLHIKLLNQQVMRLNQIRLLVSYYDINHHHDTVRFNDTLNLKIKKLPIVIKQKIGQEEQLTLLKPIKFNIIDDSTQLRTYRLKARFDTGATYTLNLDSAAFTDNFGRSNDTSKINFNVLSPNDYAHLSIEVKNIFGILDTTITDTANFILDKGQFILIVQDKNGKTVLKTEFNYDKKLKTNYLIPETYRIKIIYDKNKNNRWDSGDYFKHIQPEKIIFYKSNITLSKGEEKNIIWDFTKTE